MTYYIMSWFSGIPYATRALLSCAVAAVWIYNRQIDYYRILPRKHIIIAGIIAVWMYLNYVEPMSLPIGLAILTYMSRKSRTSSELLGTDPNILAGSNFKTGWF